VREGFEVVLGLQRERRKAAVTNGGENLLEVQAGVGGDLAVVEDVAGRGLGDLIRRGPTAPSGARRDGQRRPDGRGRASTHGDLLLLERDTVDDQLETKQVSLVRLRGEAPRLFVGVDREDGPADRRGGQRSYDDIAAVGVLQPCFERQTLISSVKKWMRTVDGDGERNAVA
jgi:hypothetical protein